MSYINYTQREDAQDDTLKFLALVLFRAAEAIRTKDPHMLYTEVEIMYLTFQAKLTEEERKDLERRMECIDNSLYSVKGRVKNTQGLSDAYVRIKQLYRAMCAILIRKGILLRAETDLDSLVARRSG